jgi:hypothetical protein
MKACGTDVLALMVIPLGIREGSDNPEASLMPKEGRRNMRQQGKLGFGAIVPRRAGT